MRKIWRSRKWRHCDCCSFTRILLEAGSQTAWRDGNKNLQLTGHGLQGNCSAAVGLAVKCGRPWQKQIDSWARNMILPTFMDTVFCILPSSLGMKTFLFATQVAEEFMQSYTHTRRHLPFPFGDGMAELDWSDCCVILSLFHCVRDAMRRCCVKCHLKASKLAVYAAVQFCMERGLGWEGCLSALSQ